MAKTDKIELELQRISAARRSGMSAETAKVLAQGLASPHPIIVQSAAAATLMLDARELTPLLAPAFDRFMGNNAGRDLGCQAKYACLKALNAFEKAEEGLLLTGTHHVQMEPVYGGPVDVAGPLRGESLIGLVNIDSDHSAPEAARLLADPLWEVRANAARALGGLGVHGSALLLRYKIFSGDEEPEVIAEAYGALMRADPKGSRVFVEQRLMELEDDEAIGAALALATVPSPRTLDLLVRKRNASRALSLRRGLLTPIAILRSDEAFAELLRIITTESAEMAAGAIHACAVCVTSDERRGAVVQAAENRGERLVREALRKLDP